MKNDAPMSHPLRPAELASRKPTRFKLSPDPAMRKRIASHLGIDAVSELTFHGELRPTGRHDWALSAELKARVQQPCVATLAPVVTALTEQVERRYLAELPKPEPEEAEMPEDDTIEQLPDVIDVAEVMLEAMALALPLYPRAKGAEAPAVEARPDGAAPITDETRRPFAGLADLLNKPKGDAS